MSGPHRTANSRPTGTVLPEKYLAARVEQKETRDDK